MKKIKYYLGIDGGGTKTALVLTDTNNNIIKSHISNCCNPMDIGFENATKTISDAIHIVCEGIDLGEVSVFAGIAGGTSGGMKEKFYEFFRGFGFGKHQNGSDIQSIVAGGLGKGDGIAVITGTGVCCFPQKNGKLMSRIGGWGYLFDEGGSAYNLGRDALSAYFRCFDGSGESTAIYDILSEKYPDAQELLGEMYKGGKKVIASLAPVVFQAMDMGDDVAREIIEKNMACVAKIIETAGKHFDVKPIKAVIAGGLTSRTETLEYIKKSISNPQDFNIEILNCSPVMGAVEMAKEI